MKDRIIAIIPARSGSKGLPDKNIRQLNGKPMMGYTIEAAKNSGIFEDVIVSTDSDKYAKIAEKYGARVPFLRPERLSIDTASTKDVIIHAIKKMKTEFHKGYDLFMLLQPTSPLRNAEHIKEAYDLFKNKKANAVVSVCKADHNPKLYKKLDNSLSLDGFLDDIKSVRRQDMADYYRLNGAIYLSDINYFLSYKNFFKLDSYAYKMGKKESVDIDGIIDFKLAQVLLDEIVKD